MFYIYKMQSNKNSIVLDSYKVLKTLSSQANVKVALVGELISKKTYVCKMLKTKPVLQMSAMRSEFSKEINVLRNCSHQNLIKLIDFSDCSFYQKNRHYSECMYYITEYCEAGDLYSFLGENFNGIGEVQAKCLFIQMASVLNYVHAMGYAHGDIRLENFVMSDRSTVKLIDFGLVKKVDELSTDFTGSNYYMAPEIIEKVQYFPGKADVFATGCVLFALVFGCPAFYLASLSDSWYKVLSQNPDLFWRHYQCKIQQEVSNNLKDLLQKMLTCDPNHRISITDILSHPWLQ